MKESVFELGGVAMRIGVLCSDSEHPVFPYLSDWVGKVGQRCDCELVTRAADLRGGDLLFLVSSHERVNSAVLSSYSHALVLHASDLPRDRGWSPHIWNIVEGQREIVVSLLEAATSIDTGAIWAKRSFRLSGHELYDEINAALFRIEIELMDFAIENHDRIQSVPQEQVGATYRRRRTQEDSRINLDLPLRSQFPILQVSDPRRFPAFFEKDGFIYDINIRKRSSKTEAVR